jgi:hypothetical protein
MTSGSKYRIVGWGLLWCSGLFWRLLDDEVDDTRDGSTSHFLVGPALLCFLVFIVVSAVVLASPPTLTWSSRVGGMEALPDLILPYRGRWHMADMRPLALDACEDISYLRTYSWVFTRGMWLFTGEPWPSVGGSRG